MPGHDIIVIGASAGGVETLMKLIKNLPKNLPASIFVVLHIPAEGPDLLPTILGRSGLLKAVHATDTLPIETGCIYTAPPDNHMLLEDGHIRIVHGPKENRHRPGVDPLFRSAALVYSTRVIGVILSGALDDGTVGLQAIKHRGGVTVVQSPKEALYPGMPQSALNFVQVDYCLPVAEISSLLTRLAGEPAKGNNSYPIAHSLEHEVKIAKMDMKTLNDEKPEGTSSVFSCPECGGILWEIQSDAMIRFRCRVGHSFTSESIQSAQIEAFEQALWTAYKTLQESTNFSYRMAKRAQEYGNIQLAGTYEEKAKDTQQRANIMNNVLLKGHLGVLAAETPSSPKTHSDEDP